MLCCIFRSRNGQQPKRTNAPPVYHCVEPEQQREVPSPHDQPYQYVETRQQFHKQPPLNQPITECEGPIYHEVVDLRSRLDIPESSDNNMRVSELESYESDYRENDFEVSLASMMSGFKKPDRSSDPAKATVNRGGNSNSLGTRFVAWVSDSVFHSRKDEEGTVANPIYETKGQKELTI